MPYAKESDRKQLDRERRKGRDVVEKAEKRGNVRALGKLQHALVKHGIDLGDLGNVKAVWAKTAIDEKGDDFVEGASILLAPSWETGPAWPVVQPARPVSIKVPKTRAPALVGRWKTAVVLPDPQIGFRRLADGGLDPFHDDRALDIAMQVVEHERPDLTVWLGDHLDFASFGKYRQEPSFATTTQAAVDRAYEVLATTAELSGATRLLEGNHDVRLQNSIIDNAAAAFGIRRAKAPDEWPALSVPNLLRCDELDVKYVSGYPVGATYINDNLACIHGRVVAPRGRSSATMVSDDERVSIIFGHVHRIETTYRTRNSRDAAKFSMAHTPGCLCRIDGAVPGTDAGIDPHGRPVRHWQNWQQGLAVVRYEEGDGRFVLESVPIFEGWAAHRGQEYVARG